MVTVLRRSAQGALLRLPRPQALGDAERFRSGGRHRRRVGVPGPVPAAGRRRRRRHALGARRRHQPGRPSPADPAGSTSSAASTARASSTTTRRIGRSGSTTARTSTRRSRSPTCPPSDGRRIWMGWISNWLYANDEPTAPWRGAQSVPRVLPLARLPEGIRLVQAPGRELDGAADRRRSLG